MNGIEKKITIALLLFGLIFVFAVRQSNAAETQAQASKQVKIKGAQEILVARDIGGGLSFSLIEWCGNDSLLLYGDEFGTELLFFNGNKTTVSSKSTDYPIGCTPDGKWVIYMDRNSAHEYRDKSGMAPEVLVDDGPGWYGFVIDLYRYEIATGMRQRFAVVRDDSAALVSPDGSKVFLGNRHDSAIEMPEPKWETVWFTNDWTYLTTFWLPDSSGIVTTVWGADASLGVEFFGKNGWAKEFSLDMLSPSSSYLKAIDDKGRLYFITKTSAGDRAGEAIYGYFRCEIKNKELICEAIGTLDERGDPIAEDILLPNGNIVLKSYGDHCIRIMKAWQPDGECIAETKYYNDIYEDLHLIGVSPDGRRMAFRRGKLPPPGKRFYAYQYDLFVKELSDD